MGEDLFAAVTVILMINIFAVLLVVLMILYAMLDVTYGRRVRAWLQARDRRKREGRVAARDLVRYLREQAEREKALDEPVDARVIRHLRS
jgi:hypothetical protein